MKIMKLAALAGITLFLSGCGPEEKDQTSIKMWIAPNVTQEVYWGEVVKEWNSNPANRKVEFTPIPAAGSSEEAIMKALASGTEPDISTNIFIGFAKQLSELKQLNDYAKMPGFQELVETRHMGKAMASWQFEGSKMLSRFISARSCTGGAAICWLSKVLIMCRPPMMRFTRCQNG